MKPCLIFPRADEATALHRLVLHMDREWPSEGRKKAEMARAVARHAGRDRLQAAADWVEHDVGGRLSDLAADLAQAADNLDWVKM